MDEVIKSSHTLAGWTALSGEGTCGALAGGIMAICFVHGRALKDMGRGRSLKSYTLAKKLYDKFAGEFGSCLCKDVQRKIFGRSFDLLDAEDFREFERFVRLHFRRSYKLGEGSQQRKACNSLL